MQAPLQTLPARTGVPGATLIPLLGGPVVADPSTLVPTYLRDDITATLARLRTARTVNPRHEPGKLHAGCDVCTSEKRLNWLLGQISGG